MYPSSIIVLLASLSAISVQAAPLPQAAEASCPTDGAIICSSDGQSFYMCNWGKAKAMGGVAAGTICKDGAIYAIGSSQIIAGTPTVSDTVPIQTTAPPTTSELSSVSQTTPAPIASTQEQTATSEQQTRSTTVIHTIQTTSLIIETRTRSTPVPTTSNVETTTQVASNIVSPPAVQTTEAVEPSMTSATENPPAASTTASTASSGGDISTAQLLAIAPQAANCNGAPFANECSTADHGVSFINAAFSKYGITTKGEKAALISIMAFESGEFKYNINHYPGTPGQGTRNMMNFPFILQYINSIPALASQVPTGTTASSASDDVKNTVRALVLDDEHSFASAAWFLTTQCSSVVRSGLQSGTDETAWEGYISGCVGTTVTDARKAYWTAAVNAL